LLLGLFLLDPRRPRFFRGLMSTQQEQDDYIFSCVRHNRLDEVKAWLDAGNAPDLRDYAGNTLLVRRCTAPRCPLRHAPPPLCA
jgi:hypothetical protein